MKIAFEEKASCAGYGTYGRVKNYAFIRFRTLHQFFNVVKYIILDETKSFFFGIKVVKLEILPSPFMAFW